MTAAAFSPPRRLPRADAYYRVFSYVVSKLIVEIPATVVSSFCWTAIVYLSVGLRDDPGAFLFFVFAVWINQCVAMVVGFTLCSVLKGDIAPAILLPVWATLHSLVAGFLVSYNTMPGARRGEGGSGLLSSSVLRRRKRGLLLPRSPRRFALPACGRRS